MRITPLRIYIVGQIKGLPIDVARSNFERVETQLREMGYEPVNPFKIGIPDHWEYSQSRPYNMKALHQCEALYIQSNWRNSEGSMDEINEAMKSKMDLFYAEANGMNMLHDKSRDLYQREAVS